MGPNRTLLLGVAVTALLFAVGCSTAAKTERSAAITAAGDASIENWKGRNPYGSRAYVLRIDGALVQPKDQKGVYALAAGRHTLHVNCAFGRMALTDLVIDAGEAQVEFEARAGTRYRIVGDKLSRTRAEIVIEDVTSGARVVGPIEVPLTDNPQNIPLLIPIPVGR